MKKNICILICILFTLCLFGCSGPKYTVKVDTDFPKPRKTHYAEGETVTVYYNMIATDTDYSFHTDSDDITLREDYDDRHGYVLEFTMPAHDVFVYSTHKNSMYMEYEPETYETETKTDETE